MMLRRFSWIATIAMTSVPMLVGCGNMPPTVNAGPDVDVGVGRLFNIVPTIQDEDGDELTVAWTIISSPTGSQAELSDGFLDHHVRFVPDVEGVYRLLVTASDGGATVEDTVELTARVPPNLSLLVGIDQEPAVPILTEAFIMTIRPERDIIFDARSSTVATGADRELAFQWVISPPGPLPGREMDTSWLTFTLNSVAGTAPIYRGRVRGMYELTVSVGDSGRTENGDLKPITSEKLIQLYVRNAPIVQIDAPDAAIVNRPVELDGSNSKVDIWQEPKYTWSVISAPAEGRATIEDDSAATTTVTMDSPGRYVFKLEVDDGGLTSSVEKEITATFR